MIKPKKRKSEARFAREEKIAISNIEALAEFEDFKATLLPSLRKDLQKGTPAKEILEKVKGLAAARLGTIVATEIDSGKALSAIKDLLDRTEGKAKETVETTHKFEKLKDQEIDALLTSRLKEIEEVDEKKNH